MSGNKRLAEAEILGPPDFVHAFGAAGAQVRRSGLDPRVKPEDDDGVGRQSHRRMTTARGAMDGKSLLRPPLPSRLAKRAEAAKCAPRGPVAQ